MIMLISFLSHLLGSMIGIVLGWTLYARHLKRRQTAVVDRVVHEQIRLLDSRARAAEATVKELNVMIANFRVIVDNQAVALKVPLATQGSGQARIWVPANEVFSAWKRLRNSSPQQGGVIFAGKLLEAPRLEQEGEKNGSVSGG